MVSKPLDTMQILKSMRSDILEASSNSQEGHIPSAYSVLELIYSIYLGNWNRDKSVDLDFILSKGHASLALYSTLEKARFIGSDWKSNFAEFESDYGGHPDMNKVNGVSASTGSLGHGLPIALGKAFAYRILNKNKKIYCLVGDGEINEGSIWESLLLASHHKMHEMVVILDFNHSTDRALAISDVKNKFEAFGFRTFEVDGHNLEQIDAVLESSKESTLTAIIANTIKGYGLSGMENNPAWHHLSPRADELDGLKSEIR
jgi:transketolase